MRKPGFIAAGHETTADTAAGVLRVGGNAFDAAAAALATTFVTEPCMSSPGGGGFATYRLANGKVGVLDFFCQTPQNKILNTDPDFYPITVNFGDTTEDFYVGLASMAVPGCLAGLTELHRLGRMPFSELLQPAIAQAKEGVPVNAFQRLDFELLRDILHKDPAARDIFFKAGERLIELGELLRMPRMASFLDFVARDGIGEFYRGEIAARLEETCSDNGGFLTRADLAGYRVHHRRPLHYAYGTHCIITNPTPSMGGSLLALGLQHLTEHAHYSGTHIDRMQHLLAELSFMSRDPETLRYRLCNPAVPKLDNSSRGGTTHFSIVDGQGNAVAVTVSNGEGSGYLLPGTDVMMNNMLGETALLPMGHHTWDLDVRLSSMMSPTIVTDEQHELTAVCGTGGAGRIPTAILQVLHYYLDRGKPLHEAVHAPRAFVGHDTLYFEPGFEAAPTAIDGLSQQPFAESSLFFGGVHSVARTGDTYTAVGDARRHGVARRVE